IITGKTPLEFIRNIKMQHAYYLLANKESSITEVAANLGYFNRKYFTTCFKEEFGMTPSEYQKSVGKGTFVANEGDK
ncbi:MAG: helix-turn-helix domain-containing protein, partial [Phocaeicola sp.]